MEVVNFMVPEESVGTVTVVNRSAELEADREFQILEDATETQRSYKRLMLCV